MVFEYFHKYQSGFVNPRTVKELQITKRAAHLELGRSRSFQCVHKAGVTCLDLDSAESRYLLSGSRDGSFYIHDTYNLSGQGEHVGKCVCKMRDGLTHKYSIECVLWYTSDNGLFTTSGKDCLLKVWDANCMKPVEVYQSRGQISNHHMTPIPNSHNLISIASSLNHIHLFDLRTGSSTHELYGHSHPVTITCWSPRDEYLLVSGSLDNQIKFWDVRSSRSCLKSLDKDNQTNSASPKAHLGHVNYLKFTPDGLFLISYGSDKKIRLWETLNGTNQMIEYEKVKQKLKQCIQFSVCYDSKPVLLYIPCEDRIHVFELFTGKLQRILSGHFNHVTSCIYVEDYQMLFSGSYDKNILVWSYDPHEDAECLDALRAEADSWSDVDDGG